MKTGLLAYWMAFCLMFTTHAQTAGAVDEPELCKANTAFALQMYDHLRTADGNLVFSPYSISSALAMTYAGARGDTARQMAHTLHFDQNSANIHPLFKDLAHALTNACGKNELEIANSLWPQEGYPIQKSFLDLLRDNYGAEPQPLNYERDADGAAKTINHWVDDQTHHKISEIIGPGTLNASTRLVLVNAIYFKGRWASPFEESATRPSDFHVSATKTATVPFMNKQGDFRYAMNSQLQALALSYAGSQLELVILLPRQPDGLASLETNLTLSNLSGWTASLRRQSVQVLLPKFKLTTARQLNQTLEAMGMTGAFSPARADFSGMDGRAHWLYLSAVLHKAFIDVNEEGTEAAATTAVAVRALAIRMPERPAHLFRADHPFLFLLRDSTTGTILFLGRVTNPAASPAP